MLRFFCKVVLKLGGWKAYGFPPPVNKCIIISAPHTSYWDFFWGFVFFTAIGGKGSYLIKKEMFFFPLNLILRKLGALPVDRSAGVNSLNETAKVFEQQLHIHLGITPEGTTNLTTKWKAGFYFLAKRVNAPVYLHVLDFGKREQHLTGPFALTDNVKNDINRLKLFYRDTEAIGKNPENFSTDTQ